MLCLPKKTAPLDFEDAFEVVSVSEFEGVRYLHLGYTDTVQGAMRIARPFKLEIEYIRNMMAWEEAYPDDAPPEHIVQLGLGVGSLSKYCWRNYPKSRITAVEYNPQVIRICRHLFKLPPDDDRLSVIQADAGAWVADPQNHATVDVMQVDLYDAAAKGPVLDTEDFYCKVRACLRAGGIATINLFGNTTDRRGFDESYANIKAAFAGQCYAMPQVPDGNIVVVAQA